MNKFIIIEFHQSLQSNFTVSGNFTPGVATVLYSKHINVGIPGYWLLAKRLLGK